MGNKLVGGSWGGGGGGGGGSRDLEDGCEGLLHHLEQRSRQNA